MEEVTLNISFDDVDPGQANLLAANLKFYIESETEGCIARQVRTGEKTMDFGTTLVLVLGTSAVTAVAHGIRDWLSMKPQSTITITRPGTQPDTETQVVATGLGAKDVARVLEELVKTQRPS